MCLQEIIASHTFQFIFSELTIHFLCQKRLNYLLYTALLRAAGHFLIMDFISRDWNRDNLFPRAEWTLGVGLGPGDCRPLIGKQTVDQASHWLTQLRANLK